MRDAPTPAPVARNHSHFAEALRHVEKVLAEGLCHGFFECSIACEIVKDGKRQLVIRAGKSHKFIIPEGDLPG